MINTFRKNTQLVGSKSRQLAVVCALVLIMAGCGVDESDGVDVTNGLALPTDTALNLYCADIGIFTESCVLDDPDNPYALVSVTNDNKFDLANAAPSEKARFYLWATALARDSTGENQLNLATTLYRLSDASGSDFIRDHALRAYRSVLDNYLDSITFFSTDDFATFPTVFYPFPVGVVAADQLRLGVGGTLMFDDTDPVRNDFLARVQMVEWGFLYDDALGEVIKL